MEITKEMTMTKNSFNKSKNCTSFTNHLKRRSVIKRQKSQTTSDYK